MRKYSKNPKEYDNHLRNEILLTEPEVKGKASHEIWKSF